MSASMLSLIAGILFCFIALSEETFVIKHRDPCEKPCRNDLQCRSYSSNKKCKCQSVIYPRLYYGFRRKCCCHKDAHCVYSYHRYSCECNDHYYGDGIVDCRRKKNCGERCYQKSDCGHGGKCECKAVTSPIAYQTHKCCCHNNAHCVYRHGGYDCECDEGYYRVGDECKRKINCRERCYQKDDCGHGGKCECKAVTFPIAYKTHKCCCHKYAHCVYRHGKYDCVCNKDYIGNGVDCKPKDDCGKPCTSNRQCKISYGNDKCDTCQNVVLAYGYSRKKCCCHKWAHCILNRYGSYSCRCRRGYTGSGHYCAPRVYTSHRGS